MKKLILLLGIIFAAGTVMASGEKPQSNHETKIISESAPATGPVYRCNEGHLLWDYEWIMIDIADDGINIDKIWYWNTLDTKPESLIILDYEFIGGGIDAFIGSLMFMHRDEIYDFTIVDETFTLETDDEILEFEFEYWND